MRRQNCQRRVGGVAFGNSSGIQLHAGLIQHHSPIASVEMELSIAAAGRSFSQRAGLRKPVFRASLTPQSNHRPQCHIEGAVRLRG